MIQVLKKDSMKNWRNNNVNIAVQVLPQAEGRISYHLVDKVIEAIKETGLTYEVCPFETVVECRYSELSSLIDKIHNAAYESGAEHMLTNLKIQVDFEKNVTIDDKMEKYR
jgi:uncharacterized protein YqgV (UPF0045/DUF77 family)